MDEVRARIGQVLKVAPAEVRLSSDKQWAVVLRGPPPPPPNRKPPKGPRRWQLVVTAVDGKRPLTFRPVTLPHSDQPPKDVHFLADNRLVYEVVAPPPLPVPVKPAKARSKKSQRPHQAIAPAQPRPPERLFVIQPLRPRARPLRLPASAAAFTTTGDHLALLVGGPDAALVSVDGVQVYPRKGRAAISCEPAWSRDGHSLAFLERRAPAPPRLVLLAEYDNASGDTLWELPATAALDGAHVYWAGPGKLVVGRSVGKPIFATSFDKQPAPPAWREP
jgi:hypothetical protein